MLLLFLMILKKTIYFSNFVRSSNCIMVVNNGIIKDILLIKKANKYNL